MGHVGHLDYWTRVFPKGQTWPARVTGGVSVKGERDEGKHQETHSGFSNFRVAFPGFPSATKSPHIRLHALPMCLNILRHLRLRPLDASLKADLRVS